MHNIVIHFKNLFSSKKKNLLLTLIILIIFYFIYPGVLYNYFIPPIIKDNVIYLFGDWSGIVSAIKCKSLGYDVFSNNPCDILQRKHVYGSVLLFFPYEDKYKDFILFYFPIIFNIFFILVIIIHFDLKNLKEIFLCIIFIFNTSTLLVMERFNFDIIIFLSMIFLCYFRSNVFNLLLILFLTLAKFYPILFSPIFFFNKKIKKIFVNYIYFLIFIILTFIILYLDRNNLFKIFNNIEEFQAVYAWSFNFFALSKIPDVKVLLSNQLLISFSFFLFFIFFLLGFYLSKKTRLERDFILTNNLYYKELLFLISSGLLVSVYFIFNNVIYREIFLFGLIPLLLTLNKKNSFFIIN
jgi:hypothetical protein